MDKYIGIYIYLCFQASGFRDSAPIMENHSAEKMEIK